VRTLKIKAKGAFMTLRIRKGFTITSLAMQMKVNPSVVFRIEKGNYVRPTTAYKACIILEEEFDTLFIIENE
jgi:DNA-binding XRE family transcriptional regulator